MTSSAQDIPAQHDGIFYVDFMKDLSQKRRVKKYLEVGVDKGHLLSVVHADEAFGVDPSFDLIVNVCANKKSVHLFQCTSDEFFADQEKASRARDADLVFLDGYHTFEFLLRDFANVEKNSHPRTLVGMHDVLPLDGIMTTRELSAWKEKTRGSAFEGWWTGDVWKTVAILRKYRPDLTIVCVGCPPTGIVFITNLDPTHSGIDRSYLEITQEFANIENNITNIKSFYQEINIISPARILNENDNTLYFKT